MKHFRWCLCGLALVLGASVALAQGGPGYFELPLMNEDDVVIGAAHVHNSPQNFMVHLEAYEPWLVTEVQIYAGYDREDIDPIPTTKKGNVIPGQFPYKAELAVPRHDYELTVGLKDGLGFSWGSQYTELRVVTLLVHGDFVHLDTYGELIAETGAWARGAVPVPADAWKFTYRLGHPRRGHFIDSPVRGLGYKGPTQQGVTGYDEMGLPLEQGGFSFFTDETIGFAIGSIPLGAAEAANKISPLDLFSGADVNDPRVIGVARTLQTLDFDSGAEQRDGKIVITPQVSACFSLVASGYLDADGLIDWGDGLLIDDLLAGVVADCNGAGGAELAVVSPEAAADELVSGLNASGIFRKNISKTEDWGETKQKLDVMPVYFPALRSDGTPSICCIDDPLTEEVDECDVEVCDNPDTPENECGEPGVPYAEWRKVVEGELVECDPRLPEGGLDPDCEVTPLECRPLAKPIITTYLEKIDIYDDQVTTEFWPGRFAWDVYTAISRDDGTTWKRMNVSRAADLSSFDLETGEPFPGTSGSPYLKVNDNYILNVWESKYCKSGNPRYAIDNCKLYPDDCVDLDEDGIPESVCRGNADQGTYVCEEDYPYDDQYYVPDIWGVRGQQQSVDYNEVDDVAELGIGEIPYSCLWAARGVIVTQKELAEGTLASVNGYDDECTAEGAPYECCTGEGTGIDCALYFDETQCTAEGAPYECCTGDGTGECEVGLGDIVWFKPERLTSGRRDAYIPVLGSARGAGFAIAWQEDPDGLRPGKGKGPGEGWSGAISNHKSDIWYSFISHDNFGKVDAEFVPGGPGGGTDGEPTGDEGYLDKPGLGRPKAQVPFSLPVRVSDNDMVNTHTLKVQPSETCVEPPGGDPENPDPVCFPEVVDGSFVPIDPEEIAAEFCGYEGPLPHDPATCCDPNDHEGDPDCEDLKGLYGNMSGTKRYAYLARSIDVLDNLTGQPPLDGLIGDGIPDYQYYLDRGSTLDLCDTTGANLDSYMEILPGESRERWFGFTNVAGASKLVCVTSDGRLLDGDVFAARPMLQLQPYTKPDGTKSAWALLAYEESKGMGHSLAAAEHEDTEHGDEIIGEQPDETGQNKPIKQDLGKNMLYHSFDFSEPDLVHPGHIVNLPALCGGLYPTYCDDPKTPDVIETFENNPTCTCTAGQPVPLYFDYLEDVDGDPETPDEWIPDDTQFLQFRTEIARRARFLVQSYGKIGDTRTAGAIIYKQGQEGQGRPADVFIRRIVVPTEVENPDGTTRAFSPKKDNPFAFENFECSTYLDQTFDLPPCPTDGVQGYNCNVWGEAFGDRLCGGVFTDPNGGYPRRDHINLTSFDIDYAVDAGPDDETPDDPTDDRYGTNKVLLWSQHEYNLGDESYGFVDVDGTPCAVIGWEQDPVSGEWTPVEPEVCPAMYSNARSHRGFIRGDLLVTAFSMSPNWAAGRNGNDRYNFYVRRSFDGGQTWTTTPADLGGTGAYVCPEFRSDPNNPDPDGSGNLPPQVLLDAASGTCGVYDPATVPDGELPPLPVEIGMSNYLDPMGTTTDGVPAQFIAAGAFEPGRNISQIKSNHESSGDPRLGTTPPTYPLDGTTVLSNGAMPILRYVEDEYVDNMFFVAWGTVDNAKSTGSTGVKAEAGPLDLFFTRTEDYGDSFVKIPWVIGGENSNQGYGETVWRYDFIAKGEPEEQGEAQLRATSDGSKAYVIWHSQISAEEDPDEVYTRWYPWKPSESSENDLWFRRLIFWPTDLEFPWPEEPVSITADTSTYGDEPVDGATFDEGGGAWDGGTIDAIDPVAPAVTTLPEPTVDVARTPVPTAPVVEPVQPMVLETPTAELPAAPTVSAPTSPTPAIVQIAQAEAPAAMPPADTVVADAKPTVPARSFVQPYGEREQAVREESGEKNGNDQSESACEIYAVFELTPEGLQMRSIYHHDLPGALDPYEPVTEWHEWERAPTDTSPDSVWLRQWILCDEEVE